MKYLKSLKPFELIEIILGNTILAFAYGCFIIPANILGGGLAGLSIALQPLFPINTEWFVAIMTYGLFFLGLFLLGKKFSLTTLLSSLIFPPLLAFFSINGPHIPVENEIVFSFYGGLLMGFGCGLVFKAGSSTGGLDIPPVILNKYFNIKIQTSVIAIDAFIVCLGFFTRGAYPALVGLIAVFACSYSIEKTMLLGSGNSLQVLIISDYYSEIEQSLMRNLNRGITRLKAQGAYYNKDREVLMILIHQKQYPKLLKIVNSYDSHAFLSVSEVREVYGLGFRGYE